MAQLNDKQYYIGIDVGTASVRASLFKPDGALVSTSIQPIHTHRDVANRLIFEQSTTEIWSSICTAVKSILAEANVDKHAVKGLGFDATCSLAVVDWNGRPIVVSEGERLGTVGERNIILWADLRAGGEAKAIDATGSVLLDYFGGTMGIELEIPKLLWLKNNMTPSAFSNCQFFSLPDYLTYRATGDPARSCSSLTSKCSFVDRLGWKDEFFSAINLGEFCRTGYKQIGAGDSEKGAKMVGMPIGRGLERKAAEELGLVEGTPVGSALVDCNAGWVGTVAARLKDGRLSDVAPSLKQSAHRLVLIAGTSTCHLVQSPEKIFVKGVWGPYKGAMFRDWWMTEGGQSSTGQLIDFMITTHPAYLQLVALAKGRQSDLYQVLRELLEKLRVESGVESLTELTKDMHLYPDLHGNRSPIADPHMRGSFMGLELDSSITDLAKKYNLTLESIALQTRHILDSLNGAGHSVKEIYVTGGQARNHTLMQLIANVCGVGVVLPGEGGGGVAVTRGAAILGRVAKEVGAGVSGELLWEIMVQMTPPGTMVRPVAGPKEKRLLEAKYKIFLETIQIQKRWRLAMEAAAQ